MLGRWAVVLFVVLPALVLAVYTSTSQQAFYNAISLLVGIYVGSVILCWAAGKVR